MADHNRYRKDAEFMAAVMKGKNNSPWSRGPMCNSKRAKAIQKTRNWKEAADRIPHNKTK